MGTWFEVGNRLDRELEALDASEIAYTIDEEARSGGLLRLDLRLPLNGPWRCALELTATFPPEYPYFRPYVVAKELSLARHQHPFSRNLCLLGRSTLEWDVDQTLAGHLTEQLPKLLSAVAKEPETLVNDSAEQAEPYSDYYTYAPNSAVLLDARIRIPSEKTAGTLVLQIAKSVPSFLRAAVMGIEDESGVSLGEADFGLARGLGDSEAATGRWVRIDGPLPFESAEEALRALRQEHPQLLARTRRRAASGRGRGRGRGRKARPSSRPAVVGVVFPEERAPGVYDDGWVFIVEDEFTKPSVYYARAMRADAVSRLERVPELVPLNDAKVGLVGLGCVGMPMALELLRAGVGTLRALDHDVVDAATLARWPVGLASAGFLKADVLYQIARRDYPFTNVESCVLPIGAPHMDSEVRSPFLRPEEFFHGLDLIIDASAEFAVQHYLAERARAAGIPFIHASGTRGGWGGLVFRVLPGVGNPCWYCVRHGIENAALPSPPEAPARLGTVQPVGCADPTFTGAGFDLSQVSLHAARLAIATLCRGTDGYPDFEEDYAALSLRTREGKAIPATWAPSAVQLHPTCLGCGA